VPPFGKQLQSDPWTKTDFFFFDRGFEIFKFVRSPAGSFFFSWASLRGDLINVTDRFPATTVSLFVRRTSAVVPFASKFGHPYPLKKRRF